MFQQPIKNFKINFNALNADSTFSGGDTVSGQMSFDIIKPTKITSIKIIVNGKANVHWSSGSRKHRRHHSATVEFFNFNNVLLQENSAAGETEIPPGTHVYPFMCPLPNGNFPSSFTGLSGKVSYTLTVGIKRPWHLSKEYVTEFTYVNRIDANQPHLLAPLSGTIDTTLGCLCCVSGRITMTATLQKKVFFPGETVIIVCDFSNGSSRVASPKAKLQQTQSYYTYNRGTRRIVPIYLGSVNGDPVAARTPRKHAEIMLTIPPTAPPTIDNCSILNVTYVIEMNFGTRASPGIQVLFPIILSYTPVNIPLPICE